MIESVNSIESTQSVNFKKKHQETEEQQVSPSSPSSLIANNKEENEIIETSQESNNNNNNNKENQKENEIEEKVKESQDPLEMRMESRDSCNEQSLTLSCNNDEEVVPVVPVASTDSIEVDMIGLSSNSILDSNLNLEHRLKENVNEEETDSPSNDSVANDDTSNVDDDDSMTDPQESSNNDDNISYEEEEEIQEVIQEEMKEEMKDVPNDISMTPTANETETTTPSRNKIDTIPSSPPSDTKYEYESPIKASTSNDTHSSTISAHMEIHSLKEFYEKKLHLQKQTHDQQIYEVLHQLNHLESTYEDQLLQLREKVTKTNIMNEALMNQLVVYKEKLEQESQLVQSSKKELQELQASIEEMETTHESQLQSLKSSKEDAIVQAREEIRLAAESQFAAAQKTFLKLKQDYIHLKTEKQDLEKKNTLQKDKLVVMEKTNQNCSQEMNKVLAENAELQAKLATDNAETLKLKQTYLEKANSFVQKEQNLEEKLEVLEREKRDAVRAYSVVVEEKEALKNENAELQALCEELMLIVEGNKGK